jgi:hypothetical protein
MPRDTKNCNQEVLVARQRLLEQLEQLSKSFQS